MKYWIVSGWIWLLTVSIIYGQPSHYGVEFQVNTGGYLYDIEAQSNGDFIITELSDGVCAQRFNSKGNALGSKIHVNIPRAGYELYYPAIAVQPNGDFIITWNSWNPTDKYNIYAQRFDSKGNKLGNEFKINNLPGGDENPPTVITQPNGNFIIIWASNGILAQRYDSEGNKLGNEILVNRLGRFINASVQSNGNFIITYESGYDIFVQRFDSEGNILGNKFQVNTYINDIQSLPDIASLPNGDFVITWESRFQDGFDYGIFTQRFDSEGNKLGIEFQVNTYTKSSQNHPAITAQPNGDFVITWQSHEQDGDVNGIYGQRFDFEGNKLGYEFQVNTYTKGEQWRPIIAAQPNGDFIIGWYSYGERSGAYAKIFPAQPLVHPLQNYFLINPMIDATERNCSPHFTWQKPSSLRIIFPWEIEYHLYIDTLHDFSTARIITGIYDTCYVIDTLASAHTYFWKVSALNTAGDSLWSNQTDWGFFIPGGSTDIGETEVAAGNHDGIQLLPNRPNPFNNCTTLRFQAAGSDKAHTATLALYTITGRRVREWRIPLQNGCREYETVWNGCDDLGMPMPSGIYLLRLECGSSAQSRSLLLLK